ncbi:MAG TPA: acyltransferase [Acidobacteriaceae bacterium]
MPKVNTASVPATFLTVQGLRGIAAVMVVVYHSLGLWALQIHTPVTGFWANGQAGVDIFFVISGFIMPLTIRRTGHAAADSLNFLRRRIERIYPLYWIVTTLKVALTLAVPAVAVYGLGSSYHVIASYLLLPSFHPDGSVTPIVPPGWTLTYEMFFYLLITIGIACGRSLRWFMPAVLVPVALLTFFPISHRIPIVRTELPLVLEFLAGMVLAWGVQRRPWLSKTLPNLIIAVLAFSGILFLNDTSLSRVVVWGIPAFLLVGAALNMETKLGKRIPALMLLIGDASYSIYLLHWFMMPVVKHLEQMHRLAAIRSEASTVVLGVATSVVAGTCCYLWVERPINRFFHVRRRTALAAAKYI